MVLATAVLGVHLWLTQGPQGEEKAQWDKSFWHPHHGEAPVCPKELQREPLPASTNDQSDLEAIIPVLVCPSEASS